MNRPSSVTVFGILNIAFGAFGLLGLLSTVVMFLAPGSSSNVVIRIVQENAAYRSYMMASIPLAVISCAALIATGIGLLGLKPWARTGSLVWAVYALVVGAVGVVMNFVFLTKPLLEEATRQQGAEAAGAIGGAIGGILGGCFGMIYPIVVLIFLSRGKLVAAFQPPATPPPPPI